MIRTILISILGILIGGIAGITQRQPQSAPPAKPAVVHPCGIDKCPCGCPGAVCVCKAKPEPVKPPTPAPVAPARQTVQRPIYQCQGGVCSIVGYEEVAIGSPPVQSAPQAAPAYRAASSCGPNGCAPVARPFPILRGIFGRR